MCIAAYLDLVPLLNLPAVLLDDLLVLISQVVQDLSQVLAGGSIDLHADVSPGLRLQLPHFLQSPKRAAESTGHLWGWGQRAKQGGGTKDIRGQSEDIRAALT